MKMTWHLILIAFVISNLGCQRTERETFLIPKGYRGKVNIIFNQLHGQQEKYENGRRLYEIPNNGILLTQFKDDYGWIDQRYFYVDSNGNREPLKQLDVRDFNEEWRTTKNPQEPSCDELGVFFAGRVGSMGTTNSDDPRSLKYQEFFVSTYRELKTYNDKYNREFGEKIKQLTGAPL